MGLAIWPVIVKMTADGHHQHQPQQQVNNEARALGDLFLDCRLVGFKG